MDVLTDGAGRRLLFMEEVADLAGVKVATIRTYNAWARRNRADGKPKREDLPAEATRVKRRLLKSDNQPVVVMSPVWALPDIENWLQVRHDLARKD